MLHFERDGVNYQFVIPPRCGGEPRKGVWNDPPPTEKATQDDPPPTEKAAQDDHLRHKKATLVEPPFYVQVLMVRQNAPPVFSASPGL